MGQAGAQREPSMEEILASIRKIIETNDKSGGTAKASETPAHRTESSVQRIDSPVHRIGSIGQAAEKPVHQSATAVTDDGVHGNAAQTEDEEAWSALHPVQEAAPVRGTAPQVQTALETPSREVSAPLSLADIAARMRGQNGYAIASALGEDVVGELKDMLSAGRSSDNDDDQVSVKSKAIQDAADGLELVARELARIESENTFSSQSRTPQTYAEPEAADMDVDDFVLDTAYLDDEDYDVDDEDSSTETLSKMIAPEIERQLISVDAGEKVAQSFATLDAAMAAGSQRNFDEIAEDLLRPMLQNWLDDNLPTLVERLVREEIERVSRGNRR